MVITPSAYVMENAGDNVQALIFSDNGKVVMVQRVGKRNLMTYFSDVHGTVTVTNRVNHKVKMRRSTCRVLAAVTTAGQIVSVNDL